MFLRFGHVVGQTGIIQAVMIVVLSKAITLLTTLSLSAIATKTEVTESIPDGNYEKNMSILPPMTEG